MGKGDRKSRRGKIWMGSYGKTRPRKKATATVSENKESKPKKAASKK